MIKSLRDFSIFLVFMYVLSVSIWIRISPEAVGYWEAQRDRAYDSTVGEYISDCDCMEELE